ncbi:Uncharacterised protein [Pseudomonas putida]|jgi:hypothetical protein|nr:Uncharacterised protein [Pseudomonas putida]CAB5584823.1 Uncharacterised protein [Pseudomonas putida]CAB5626260.1 Uncharacterised protein [Pseudomonas putida]CAB5626792.1 Uncharacterised protein [Pseudomonas putida]CAB5704524.1 Uncharacterised protein [Pseudomonas putida]
MATTSAQVQQLYVAYLGRAADKGDVSQVTFANGVVSHV